MVAIAADSLGHDETGPVVLHRKVRIHPRLPMIVGSSGLAFQGQTPLIDLVMNRLDDVTTRDLETALEIVTPLWGRLWDFARPISEAAARLGNRKANFDVRIGYVVNAREKLWRITFRREGVDMFSHQWQLGSVETIGDFYTRGRYANLNGEVMRTEIRTADLLGEHIRRIVQDGVDEEMLLYGEHRECQEPIDVAVVDYAGARFLPNR
ncbi:MAG: hypothetical protein E6J20_04045 [Chloroflexi bacterium]|nr:MAG: hypothetical protein E6J20_04045 [Chloroflexota bacterium]